MKDIWPVILTITMLLACVIGSVTTASVKQEKVNAQRIECEVKGGVFIRHAKPSGRFKTLTYLCLSPASIIK